MKLTEKQFTLLKTTKNDLQKIVDQLNIANSVAQIKNQALNDLLDLIADFYTIDRSKLQIDWELGTVSEEESKTS